MVPPMSKEPKSQDEIAAEHRITHPKLPRPTKEFSREAQVTKCPECGNAKGHLLGCSRSHLR